MFRADSRPVAALFAVLAAMIGPAGAQEAGQEVSFVIDRGLTEDLPYTAIYPDVLRTADDGNPETILTLQHPDAPLQCDVFAIPGAAADWTAEGALNSFDAASVQASWTPAFPGFRLTGQSVARFSSGPALQYEGQSDSSPFGVPVSIVHAEAVSDGRTYAVECLIATEVVGQGRPMVDFIIANFSTNSEGQCCINPADDRG